MSAIYFTMLTPDPKSHILFMQVDSIVSRTAEECG